MIEKRKQLAKLLTTQKLGVLATQSEGQPYGSLVFFATDLHDTKILFATNRSTRKYANLVSNPQVAMLIDSRSNKESDIREAMAVTAMGRVSEVSARERDPYQQLYLSKLPHLNEFVCQASCALLCLRVETYYLVNRFQEVTELHMEEWTSG